jgi:hypothetical protein
MLDTNTKLVQSELGAWTSKKKMSRQLGEKLIADIPEGRFKALAPFLLAAAQRILEKVDDTKQD